MLRFPLVLTFVVLALCSWGIYGPVLHLGQDAMEHSKWRPFMCVGMAYFLVAVIVPLALMAWRPESGKWSLTGIFWSLVAGAAGAIGALGIIFAFQFGGKPVYVMPIVFGMAPVVNTFVTMRMTKSTAKASPLFLLSVLLVALGTAGVFSFKPKPAKVVETQSAESNAAEVKTETKQPFSLEKTIMAVAVTVLCWGCYGPTLHKGQTKMGGSRLRPFLCVGVAYFLIAVIVPVIVLVTSSENGDWTLPGIGWSLAAGVAGAMGALGIIMAFNFGGKPVFVMPLVFGGAPVVNTLTSFTEANEIELMFWISLVCVITGAVCVLLFAPRGGPNPDPAVTAPKSVPTTP